MLARASGSLVIGVHDDAVGTLVMLLSAPVIAVVAVAMAFLLPVILPLGLFLMAADPCRQATALCPVHDATLPSDSARCLRAQDRLTL